MDQTELQSWLETNAAALEVTGVAAGVYHEGAEHYAYAGVTSVDDPLEVDERTLFQYGSTHKTFTATAIMRLVDQGLVDLDEKVRTYVPELRLADESVATEVTVLQLLNHTAGWSGDAHEDFGEGDDALERFVSSMSKLEQVTPLGSAVSYNNASLSLAGHVIAKVTGKVYEQAMRELVHDPLGLESTFMLPGEVMTRRFSVGHRQTSEGNVEVTRPWALPRAGCPAGGYGVTANARDQIAWARFHLGDGTAPDGTRLLSTELLRRMQEPTVDMAGSALGDAVGISWLLREVDGVKLVSHGGTTVGQYSQFVMIPERDFALISMTNCGPNGSQLNDQLRRWALETVLGIAEREPEPVSLPADELTPFEGRYETIAATAVISASNGGLVLTVEIKPEMLARMSEEGAEVPEQPPFPLGMLPGDGDRYVVTDGPAKGMKGYFVRDTDGRVEAVHVGGRLATRTG